MQFSYAFTPTQIAAHDGITQTSGFNFVVPRIADLGSIKLWNESTLLDTFIASSVVPTLTASYERSSEKITVSWTAGSSDDSDTTVTLRYSTDEGQTWQVLATGQVTTSLNLDATQLSGSANGLIEVSATNGTEIQTVLLEVGKIDNKPPQVGIFGSQTIQLYPGEPLVLTGVAVDLEDGEIADANLNWLDAQGKSLGISHTLVLSQGMTYGTHNITLSAIDSDGEQGKATVIATVGLNTYLPIILKSSSP